ncbi:MAG: hypothetical protein JXQ29_10820, partial [Planctomycetes bacterium]|nr:hypothetical protein [Planctomycetota bacterium]
AVERCLAADAEDARFRRLRSEVARSLGQEEVARRDEAYLEELIKRSLDADLLAPAARGGAEEGDESR